MIDFFSNDNKSQCDAFRNPSSIGTLLSVLLCVGIAISYIPQHLKIIHRRSSEGISPLFLLLGTTSGISAFANLILVSSTTIGCCTIISKYECINGQLGTIQVGVQAIFASLILIFCVLYTNDSSIQDKDEYLKIYRIFLFCLWYTLCHGLLIIFTILFDISAEKKFLFGLANFFGILATLLASFQYFPQIYTIYKLKHPGSLSISMMCMQTPGGFVWSLSLFLSPGAIWSSWLPYLTAAILQGTLLSMCIYYSTKYPEKLVAEREEIDNYNRTHENENSPLLEP